MARMNLVLSSAGVGIFAALLSYLSFDPGDFDKRVLDFALARVEVQVDNNLGDLANSAVLDKVSNLAGALSERFQRRIDELRAELRHGTDQFIADVLASACKLDCERRELARAAVRRFYDGVIEKYGVGLDRVQNLIIGEYETVMKELRTDLTIFSGSNFFAFLLSLTLSLWRSNAARHLLPISFALSIATTLALAWYIFGQNWIMTIIFSDYWGWTYLVFVVSLTLLMIDIAANKARITSFLFNGICSLAGRPHGFSPC
jgi:hypothetical protein